MKKRKKKPIYLILFHFRFKVGSIDNDMVGFSMTIGADTALKRIVDACDALITCVADKKDGQLKYIYIYIVNIYK